MKSTVIAGVLVGLMLIVMSINAIFINALANDILNHVYSLPSDANDEIFSNDEKREQIKKSINELHYKWQKNEFAVSLTMPYSELERIKTAIDLMRSYFFNENLSEYLAARMRLINALERLKHNELPSIENIL